MTQIDWSKAPEGATHFDNSYGYFCNHEGWWDVRGNHILDANQMILPNPSRYTPKPVACNGKDLPPVGSYVHVYDNGYLIYGQGESGEVVAHVEDTAVIRMSYGLGCFRAECLRTAEQVAAEEREERLVPMSHSYQDATGRAPSSYIQEALRALDQEGYRKQVTE